MVAALEHALATDGQFFCPHLHTGQENIGLALVSLDAVEFCQRNMGTSISLFSLLSSFLLFLVQSACNCRCLCSN